MPSVLITGASTGIGRAAAEHFARKGWTVFAGVRKEADGIALTDAEPEIRPLILDVAKPDQVHFAIDEINKVIGHTTLTGLVNNAGIAMMGPLALQPMDEIRQHFEVNVFGLLAMTKAASPLLGLDETRQGSPGRIVNITSVGGKLASPFLGSYTATKHAVESITDSFRREFIPFGIDAISIGPGAVRTPIWDKAEEKDKDTPYADTPWGDSIKAFAETMLKGGREGLTPESIAEVIDEALTAKKPKARYAPVPDKLTNFTLPMILPKRTVDSFFAKKFGLKRRG